MKLFKKLDDGNGYIVKFPNTLHFLLVVRHTSFGMSFQQTSSIIHQHCKATMNVKLRGINDHMVSQFICVFVAVDLQMIADMLYSDNVWLFAMAGD